jgi:hypothetical protein
MKDQKREAMFARVDEWVKSGISMLEFSSSIGLSKSCFEYWVRKKRKASVCSPAFLELSPRATRMVDIEPIVEHPSPGSQAQIVFTFPSGMCIKVYG